MTDDRISNCIWLLIRRAQSGDTCAGAFLADYARLKLLAGEPPPVLLRHYAPTGYEQTAAGLALSQLARTEYEQTQRNEIIKEDCNA